MLAKLGFSKEYPVDLLKQDGTIIHTLITTVSRKDSRGDVIGFQGTVRDITERRTFEEQLRRLAITDSLTGVWNRRHFMHLAEREFDRAKRCGGQLAVLLMDIDHFKRINDTYGHDLGDEALKRVAEIGKNSVRNVDIFARYGGEEFALVLPESELEQALNVAERLRQNIAETPIVGHSGSLFMTVSMGLTVGGPDSTDLATLVKRADIALYEAKRKGRNRVEVLS